MATNQEAKQAAARTASGRALDFNGDMLAMFDAASVAAGDYNGRLLAWINAQLSSAYTSLPQAMAAYGASKGVINWDAVASFGPPPSLNLDFTSSMPAGVTVNSSPAGYAKTSAGVLTSFIANAGRRTDLGILIEPAATNVHTNSQTPGNFAAVIHVTAGGTNVAPDGTSTAQKLTDDTVNTAHYVQTNILSLTSGQPYTLSGYTKAAGRTVAQFQSGNSGADSGARWDLSNGSLIASIGTFGPGTIDAHGSGWYRVAVTMNPLGQTSMGIYFQLCADPTGANYAGDAASGLLLWGVQLEQGTKATSLIKTTTGSAARAADNVSFTIPAGISTLTYTFDDNSTQAVAVSSGTYTIPTTLTRPQIKTIVGS